MGWFFTFLRTELSNRNIMQVKYSILSFEVGGWKKITGEINFQYIIYSNISQHCTIINGIFCILSSALRLWNPVCLLHSQHISVWTSHSLSAYNDLWLVATLWNCAALEGHCRLYLEHLLWTCCVFIEYYRVMSSSVLWTIEFFVLLFVISKILISSNLYQDSKFFPPVNVATKSHCQSHDRF